MEKMKRIGFVGDWHCGSRWGLTPPEYQNAFTGDRAKWMWDKWLEFWDDMPRFDLLCLMGDLIDGKQSRSDNTSIISAKLNDQVLIARDVFRAIPARKRPRKLVRVEGTSYHESFEGPLAAFDEEFNVYQPTVPEQAYVLDIKLPDGRVLNIKHTPEGSAALYMGTVQDRELLWAKVIESCNGLPEATFMARAHLHFRGRHEGYGKVIINSPCWQLQSPYALNKRYYRWQPSIGGWWMEPDPADETLGWKIHWWTRKVPALEARTYAEI